MRTVFISVVIILYSLSLWGQNVYINEISYKDVTPSDRGVELAGPENTDVNGWYMEFRNASGTIYQTETITGQPLIDNESASGKGGIWIPVAGLQQSNDRTIILYDDIGTPKDTISYGANPFADYGNEIIGGGTPVLQNLIINPGYTPQNLSGNSHTGDWVLQPESKGDLNVNQVLPVELISFKAALMVNGININWITASETNNSHFEVERSSDGMEFESIGFVPGNGSTYEEQTYEFADFIPRKSVNYYRLKQVDFNGVFEYSMVISVNILEEASIIIAPNPIQQNSELRIMRRNMNDIDFVLMNMTGQVVRFYQNLDENIITINDLSPGIYLYQIRQNNQVLKIDKLVIIR